MLKWPACHDQHVGRKVCDRRTSACCNAFCMKKYTTPTPTRFLLVMMTDIFMGPFSSYQKQTFGGIGITQCILHCMHTVCFKPKLQMDFLRFLGKIPTQKQQCNKSDFCPPLPPKRSDYSCNRTAGLNLPSLLCNTNSVLMGWLKTCCWKHCIFTPATVCWPIVSCTDFQFVISVHEKVFLFVWEREGQREKYLLRPVFLLKRVP